MAKQRELQKSPQFLAVLSNCLPEAITWEVMVIFAQSKLILEKGKLRLSVKEKIVTYGLRILPKS